MKYENIFHSISELEILRKKHKLSNDLFFINYSNQLYDSLILRDNHGYNPKLSDNDKEDNLCINKNVLKKTKFTSLINKEFLNKKLMFLEFLEYMNLQYFIVYRIYLILIKSNDINEKMSKNQFTHGLYLLYYGSVNELIKFTFDICDYEQKGYILKEDMQIILNYIPICNKDNNMDYIQNIFNSFFRDTLQNDKITLGEYKQYIEDSNNIPNNVPFLYFSYIISYIYNNINFNVKTIEKYAKLSNKNKFTLKVNKGKKHPFKKIVFASASKYVSYNLNTFKSNLTSKKIIKMNSITKLTSSKETKEKVPNNIQICNLFNAQKKSSCLNLLSYKKEFIVAKEKPEKKTSKLHINLKGIFKSNNISKTKKNIGNNVNSSIVNSKYFALSHRSKTNVKYMSIFQHKNSNVNSSSSTNIGSSYAQNDTDNMLSNENNGLKKSINNSNISLPKLDRYSETSNINLKKCSSSSEYNVSLFQNSESNEKNSNRINNSKEAKDVCSFKLYNNSISTSKKLHETVKFMRSKNKRKSLGNPIASNIVKNIINNRRKESRISEKSEEYQSENVEQNDLYEDFAYKYIDYEEERKFMKIYFQCEGNEILIYPNSNKLEIISIIFIQKTFLNKKSKELIKSEYYHSVNINYSNENCECFYFESEDKALNFFTNISDHIGLKCFKDYYRLDKELGKGTSGTVYKCTNISGSKEYAVKIIDKKNMKAKDKLMLLKEKSYLEIFNHPNIAKLIDYLEDNENIYLIIEYYQAGDMISFLEYYEKHNKYMSEKIAAKIIKKLAEIIVYIQKFGVIHRDIKAENIVFGKFNDINSMGLIDYGIAITVFHNQKSSEAVGTLAYIPPEIFLRKSYDKKVDSWSIGILLYFLIAEGLLPFDDENASNEIIGKKIVFVKHDYPNEYFINRTHELIDLIDHCLEKDIEKRITIEEILKSSWLSKFCT